MSNVSLSDQIASLVCFYFLGNKTTVKWQNITKKKNLTRTSKQATYRMRISTEELNGSVYKLVPWCYVNHLIAATLAQETPGIHKMSQLFKRFRFTEAQTRVLTVKRMPGQPHICINGLLICWSARLRLAVSLPRPAHLSLLFIYLFYPIHLEGCSFPLSRSQTT